MLDETFFEMHRAVELFRRECIADYWEKHKAADPIAPLSQRQISLLMLIHAQQPCTLSEVMTRCGLSASAASAAVDKLVRAGLVRRELNEENRRSVNISIEPAIRSSLEAVDANFRTRLAELFKDCTESELAAITQAAEIVCRRLSRRKP